jgi:hypothetical protein
MIGAKGLKEIVQYILLTDYYKRMISPDKREIE